MVPAVCGALVGGIYLMDTLSIQSVRLPSVMYRCLAVSLGGSHPLAHRRGHRSLAHDLELFRADILMICMICRSAVLGVTLAGEGRTFYMMYSNLQVEYS